jgi:flagellar hook-length control protein FliK
MIASPRVPPTADAGTTTAATTTVSQVAATPFDAILSLESLAATIATLDLADLASASESAAAAATAEGGLEEVTEAATGDDDGTDADGEQLEAGGALAFLSSLLGLPSVPAQPVSGGDATAPEADPADAGASPAQTGSQATPGPAQPGIAMLNPADQPIDGAVANNLLVPTTATATATAAAAAAAAEAAGTAADSSQGSDPAVQAPARGAEWFGHAVRHAAAPERTGIVTHARDPRWAEEFGARIALMVRGGESAASLQLSPVDLGPLEVSITVRDSQASIHFGAAQAETRNLIEASIPRLREMLAAQGFQLMDASVSQGFARQARGDTAPAQRHEADAEPEAQATTRVTATGLLDTYA